MAIFGICRSYYFVGFPAYWGEIHVRYSSPVGLFFWEIELDFSIVLYSDVAAVVLVFFS